MAKPPEAAAMAVGAADVATSRGSESRNGVILRCALARSFRMTLSGGAMAHGIPGCYNACRDKWQDQCRMKGSE